jgi:hypothetical protein
LGHDGRFPGIVVIAARLAKSEIQANANLSIARAHDDEEDRVTFESRNPATGEFIGTYPDQGAFARFRKTISWARSTAFDWQGDRLVIFSE